VEGTDPSSAPQGTTLDLRIFGSGYDAGSRADLLLNGKATEKVRTNSTTYISGTELVANISIALDATVEAYDVRVVTSGGKKGIGIDQFLVTDRTGEPWDCGSTPLSLSFGDAAGDALRSDGSGAYLDGTDGTVHLNAATGRLSLWTEQDANSAPRAVQVRTTAFTGGTTDRIYTNSHETETAEAIGCGFKQMVPGSTGSAVLEAELTSGGVDYGIVRYGKDCSGAALPANRVVTTRSADGMSWTVTGTSGLHCRQTGKKPVLGQVGTAGPFTMILMDQSP
jgi:hypothetical protein